MLKLKVLILSAIWLGIIPYLNGKILVKKDGEEPKILYTWVLGHILEMAILFIIVVPMILLKLRFTLLYYIYLSVIILLLCISIIMNRKELLPKINFKSFFKNISLYQVIFICLFVGLLAIRFKYTSINNDDSSFVAHSTSIIQTDKMYLHDDNGNLTDKLNARRVLAPLFVYYAVISKQLGIHVTILIHTIMPIVLLCIAYSLYYCFSKSIFKEKDSVYIFLIFMEILNLYTFNGKGYNKYFFLYTWFGRAILAAIILPLIWKISLDAMNKEKNTLWDWIVMFISVNAGCLCSEMAVPLISISLGGLAIINSIRDKKISYLIKSFLCIIPCILVGIMYLIIK